MATFLDGFPFQLTDQQLRDALEELAAKTVAAPTPDTMIRFGPLLVLGAVEKSRRDTQDQTRTLIHFTKLILAAALFQLVAAIVLLFTA